MSLYRPSDAYYAEFTTEHPTTGAATDASPVPTITATKNGADDGTFALTAAKIATGRYKISGTVPAGYIAGDKVQVNADAIVGGTLGSGIVDKFQVVGAGLNPNVAELPATVAGAVGSVTGNVGGNVVGSVASVASDVGITQAAADKVWNTAARTLTAFSFAVSLSAGAVQAIWDALTSALTTTGSIGKWIVDKLDVLVSTRATPAQVNTECDTALADYDGPTDAEMIARTLTSASYATAANLATVAGYLDTEIAAIKTVTDALPNAGALSTIQTDLNTIKGYTDDIGVAGAGLTSMPWNAAWDAEVQSEVDDALVAQNLDHLVKVAVDTDFSTTVHLNSVVGQLADNGTAATFDRTTDSQEAIRDRGDAAWITGAAGDPWATALSGAYGAGTAGKIVGDNLDATISSRATPAQVNAEADQALADYDAPTNTEMIARTLAAANYGTAANQATIIGYIDTEVAAILAAVVTELAEVLADTSELQTDWVNGGRLDLLIDAIKLKTDGLPVDPADASDIVASFSAVSATLATIAAYIDTEVAAIKLKTDLIPASPAAVGSAMTLSAAALDGILIESGIAAGPGLTNDSGAQLTAINARQTLAAILSACASVLSGAATTNVTFKQAAKPAGNTRIDATVTADGNRTAVVLKVPD